MDLGVAIVGCGRMGRQRARAALELGARVVSVCDPDVARARELAATAGDARVLADWGDLDLAALDAVFVCTPPGARGRLEAAVLRVGVPLFVEKPIGLSAADGEAALAALDGRPVVTAVGYMNRYRPSVQAARELLHGRPVLGISCSWAGGRYAVPWWSDAALSGGPINEQATHLVDLARYLVGEIREVRALAGDPAAGSGAPESAAVVMRFAQGALGSLLYSCQAARKAISLQVIGVDARVCLDGWDFRLRDETGRLFPEVEQDRNHVFDLEVAAFFDAIRTGSTAPVLCDLRDAMRTQRAVDAIRRALASGRAEPVG